MIRRPPRSTRSPYTTLFRSRTRKTCGAAASPVYRRGELHAANAAPSSEQAYVTDVSDRSEEHTSELQSRQYLVCRLRLEKQRTGGGAPAAAGARPCGPAQDA